jgi:flagellar biosynthesis protein FliQ
MTEEMTLQLIRTTVHTAIMVGGPLLLVALLVGLSVSIVQVVTSIHDPTLSFVPRLLAIALTLILTLPWMMERIMVFTGRLFSDLAIYVQ